MAETVFKNELVLWLNKNPNGDLCKTPSSDLSWPLFNAEDAEDAEGRRGTQVYNLFSASLCVLCVLCVRNVSPAPPEVDRLPLDPYRIGT